jgi:glutamate 5-kinase
MNWTGALATIQSNVERSKWMSDHYQRVVIKLGTSTLTAGTSKLSAPRLVDMTRQVAALHASGCEVVLVSSGAIAAGKELLAARMGTSEGLAMPVNTGNARDVPAKQMLAAVGQPRLMALYEQIFTLYGLIAGQVLLTRVDLTDRKRYLNSRNTLQALLKQHIIPIVNENDTVATEEIRVGDNDNLSALVSNLIDADLLVLLTDQAGLYTADPRKDPQAQLIDVVAQEQIPEALWQAAGGSAGELGTGGMVTKLQAADLARRCGATVIIAQGSEADVVLRLVQGERLGTTFLPVSSPTDSRKRYILTGGRSLGRLSVDDGAARALRSGSSLLPVGVKLVDGHFDRGDTVRVFDGQGKELARGLVNYASADLSRILGAQSIMIESILGYDFGEEVIHRDNMVML